MSDATEVFFYRALISKALGRGSVMLEDEHRAWSLQCQLDAERYRHCLPRPYKLPLERPRA